MSLIIASNLAKSYGAQDVFDGIGFEVPHRARIALVGPNGTGKTTILRLIVGLDQPSAGQVSRARGLRVSYMPQQARLEGTGTLWKAMEAAFVDLIAQAQRLHRLEEQMADPDLAEAAMERYGPLLEAFEMAGGYTYPARIEQVLIGLGFDPDDFHIPVAHLSGGQRTRALLARLLLENPDVLLLDEPTNHLDLDGIEWLEEYLKTWEGALVVVAHDRAFLDQVVTQVWELSFGRLTLYNGNYTHYAAQREERQERQQALYERQQEHIARTEDYIRRYKAGQRSKQALGRQKRLDRLERVDRPREAGTISIDLGQPLRSGDLVLGLYDLVVGYAPDAPLFAIDEVELRRGQCAALIGPNGSGKTSLLRTVLGDVPALSGRIRLGAGVHLGYFAQTQAQLDRDKSLLDTILDAGLPSVGRARDVLGRYRFSGDDVFKRVGDLSGGEQTRVALAVLALQGANFLMLDEPTNNLDIPSQEILQDVLTHFGGTVLLVAHDRYLIRALASRIWAIEGQRLRIFERGYDAYREWVTAERPQPAAPVLQPERERQQRDAERAAQRAAQREAERLAQQQADLEAAIHKIEARLAQLEVDLAAASTAQEVSRVAELGAEYTRLEVSLEDHLRRWEALA
ncbi:MAG: ABC-F family ATP-binding cassette domain-containing protein [Anaerolineae bacterium]|nr:ABC-F family ATP-binding cassette domain-containing protein [Anaerolineae bacterium]